MSAQYSTHKEAEPLENALQCVTKKACKVQMKSFETQVN